MASVSLKSACMAKLGNDVVRSLHEQNPYHMHQNVSDTVCQDFFREKKMEILGNVRCIVVELHPSILQWNAIGCKMQGNLIVNSVCISIFWCFKHLATCSSTASS